MPGCARSSSLFLHLIVTVVRLARPGGLRSVVAESLLVKHQLRILNRGREPDAQVQPRGQRCLEDINNFWMAHKPTTMSELYSHLHEEVEMRLAEAERVGYGFVLSPSNASVGPNGPKLHQIRAVEKVA